MTFPPTGDEPELQDNPTEEAPEPSPLTATVGSAPETVNILDQLDEETQKKYAEDVCRRTEIDLKSSAEFRKRRTSIVKLYLGQMPPPADEQMNYAQIHYAIVAVAVNRMQARIYDQQFPSNGEFFGVKPTDQEDLDRAIRVAKHLNWQVLHQIPEYVPNHDSLIVQWLLYGSAFTIFYWDPVKNRPCHETCRTDDIILPYAEMCEDPHLSTLSRITRVIRKHRHELEKIAGTGYYGNLDKIWPRDPNAVVQTTEPDTARRGADTTGREMQEVMDQWQGQDKPAAQGEDDPRPRELWEQHCWCKLKGEPEARPVIMTVDKMTKTLLGMFLREDEDPVDKARYNRENAANQAMYEAAMQKYEADLAQYYAQAGGPPQAPDVQPGGPPPDMVGPPAAGGPPAMTAPPIPGATDTTMPGAAPMVPPQPPPQPPQPAPPKMVPINFFTHYVCMPNPEGIYGIGVGALLEGFNLVADTLASQLVDAGTLANVFTFLYSRLSKIGTGEIKIKPGSGNPVDVPSQDLKNAIYPIQFTPPNPQLADFIKQQQEGAEQLSGAGEILSGEVGGSNETATTTQIRISQALAAIAIMNKRYTRARTAEAENLARLNSVYLDDDTYFHVVDPYAQPEQAIQRVPISRMDYLNDTDITVTADPRMASQPQRIADAQTALQAIMANPLTAADPLMVAAGQKGLFKAMDRPDLVAALDQMVQKLAMGMAPPGVQPGQAGGAKPANPQAQPQGPAVPMPKRVPNAGPTPANGVENGQGG